jgi:hypothetical protein
MTDGAEFGSRVASPMDERERMSDRAGVLRSTSDSVERMVCLTEPWIRLCAKSVMGGRP